MVKKIWLLLVYTAVLNAQDTLNTTAKFNQAVELYNSERFEEALYIFNSLSADDKFLYQLPAEIFRGKILINQEKFNDAEKIFRDLEKSVNGNDYYEEILLNRGIIFYNQNKFYETAEELLELVSISKGGNYEEYARKCLDTISLYKLNSEQLNVLYDVSPAEVKPLLLLLNGKNLLSEGKRNEGRNLLLKLMKQYPSSPERREAEDYYYDRKKVVKPKDEKPVIIVLFPKTSGQGAKATDEISEGIKYAVHEFNLGRNEKIGLLFLEFSRDNIKQIKNDVLNHNSKCIIGPIFSDDVRLTLTEFRGIKLPIISPTATDNDLTGYNDYFFQANPNFNLRARAMAQYIYYVENKRKMGVLNAIEGYSPLLATAFTKEFRNLGGEIIISQTYKSGSGNMDEPIERVAEIMSELEGIYLPVSDKQDIIPLLTGLSKNNIFTQMYGNQDWFLGRGYESYPMVNNMVITSDYFIDYGSYNYIAFNDEFKNVTGDYAERNALYGYDLMKYFLNQLTKINAGPEIIADRMINGNTVTGYHSNVSFDEERVNRYINIVRYSDGVFELIDKFKTGK